MSQPVPAEIPSPPAARRLPAALWILLAIAALVAALFAWKTWAPRLGEGGDSVDLGPEALDARLLEVESAISDLRRSQESMNQKLVDTRARTGLLRDEVLAVTQRSSLLEESVRELSDSRRGGAAALRLDEVELLLTLAQQRLSLAGDLAGAIRATALAQGLLATQRDPGLIDLQQTAAQELAALRSLPADPAASAAAQLDALEAELPKLATAGAAEPAPAATGSGLQRLVDSLVQVRRTGEQDLLSPADRSAGEAALALEIALARSALANHDEAGFRKAVVRVDGWLQRLFRDGPVLRERRQQLAKLRELPLKLSTPVAGSTLQQLQDYKRGRQAAP